MLYPLSYGGQRMDAAAALRGSASLDSIVDVGDVGLAARDVRGSRAVRGSPDPAPRPKVSWIVETGHNKSQTRRMALH
jgi:hypothetical protein